MVPTRPMLPKNIAKSCKYSWISYYTPKHLEKLQRYMCTTPIYLHHMDGMSNPTHRYDAQALFVEEQNDIYIAFRGSNNINDFKDVFTVLPRKETRGNVHSGFFNQYTSIQNEIDDLLGNPLRNGKEIYFVGHSLGGAAAMAAAVKTKENLPSTRVHCYTFGSPSTGDRDYIEHASSTLDNLVSVELTTDIVPNIPLNPLFTKPPRLIRLDSIDLKNPFDVLRNHSCLSYYRVLAHEERAAGEKEPGYT